MKTKPTVVVVGGGYAGLFALAQLAAKRDKVDLVLVDRKPFSENLPMLPDVVGRRVQSDNLRYDLQSYARQQGARFCRGAVASIDPERRRVTFMNGRELRADYLLICSGTESNYYGRDDLAAAVPRMDTVADAQRISRRVDEADFDHVLVVGGGYTGLELVTNIHRRLSLRHTLEGKTLHIADVAKSLLPGLDDWVRLYCIRNLERMGIAIHTGTTLESYEEGQATLSGGRQLPRCLAAWSAGVQTAPFVREIADGQPQGRLRVDSVLRFADRCYAAGDAAGMERRGQMIRPGVQFAVTEGRVAARNILREIGGREPLPCVLRDLGFVLPMANFLACGEALGMPVRGRKAMLLHYFMCIFRSIGARNRIGVICDLLS